MGVLEIQRQWIGRSEGARLVFAVADRDLDFEVYTTPCPLFGTYCVLAPEHPLVMDLLSEDNKVISQYVESAKNRSRFGTTNLPMKRKNKTCLAVDVCRSILSMESAFLFGWLTMYSPFPMGLSRSIMAVPAHDERDHAFRERVWR